MAAPSDPTNDSLRRLVTVVGEYRRHPAEGMQVVTAAIVNGLMLRGRAVATVQPRLRAIATLLIGRGPVVFTHGPGRGVVFASILLRALTRRQIIWIATRPSYPGPIGHVRFKSAHIVIGNRSHDDMRIWARDARFVRKYLGIPSDRVTRKPGEARSVRECSDALEVIHLGHVRPSRGLASIARAQVEFGNAIRTVVYASPTFAADQDVLGDLRGSGVDVRIGAIDVNEAYRSADLYLFPVTDLAGGAVELPLSVLEALAAGLPVLTTPFGILPEALANLKGVWFFSDDDHLLAMLREIVTQRRIGPIEVDSFPTELLLEGVVDTLNEVA